VPTKSTSFNENEYFNQGYSKQAVDDAGGLNEWQMQFSWDQ